MCKRTYKKRMEDKKKSKLAMDLFFLLAMVLAAGTCYSQKMKPAPKCSINAEKDKNGQVLYVLSGPGFKAVAQTAYQGLRWRRLQMHVHACDRE